ncbi:MAG: XRE family transcriptional regulator [Croceibacterium sp.]
MVDVPVNGRVLEWARTERHLTPEAAAEILQIDEDELLALERGDHPPSIGRLRDMAAKYKLPFASLMMPEPLPQTARPKVDDYRTFEGKAPELSFKLQRVLDDVWEQIDALVDVRDNAPDLFRLAGELPHVTLNADPEKIAATERERIGFSIDAQLGLEKAREAFLRWRAVLEKQGVFVRIENLGNQDNCRGFAVYDDRQIPLIFLNSDDSDEDADYRARTFSLLHEYYHLLLRQTALSDHKRSNKIEAICNQFAAFFLMPRERFLLECQRLHVQQGNITEANVKKLAEKFHTSMSSVAIHLERVGIAKPGLYETLLEDWKKRTRRKSTGRANHEERLANKLGVGFLNLVLRAADRGLLNKLDVYEMTAVKPKYLDSVTAEVTARIAAYGGA